MRHWRTIPSHPRLAWLLAALCLLPFGALAEGGEPAADDETAVETVRDRPLPARWNARYLDEPVLGSRMYVVEAGPADGEPVLLVHGLGQSGYQDWWETIDALESEYRVIALDLPGFARSSIPTGELSPPRYARVLDWLVRRLDLEDVHVVGHSMGAAVVLYYAGTYPDRVRDVVLVDAAGILQRVAFLRAVAAAQVPGQGLPDFLADRVRGLFDWGTGVVERLMLSADLDVVGILRRSDRAWNALLSDRPNVNAAVSLLETDFSRVLARFDLPATTIWGGQDGVAPIRTGHLLNGVLPDNRLRVIEEAAHVPMRTHTDAFLAHLDRALAGRKTADQGVTAGATERPDFTCRGRAGETVSGRFDRIVVDDCPGVRLVDVHARQIRVRRSEDVVLRHVTIDAGAGTGLSVSGARVTATDLSVRGDPAVRVDGGRLDVAGGDFVAPVSALVVERRSTVVLSVSRIDAGGPTGFLHGAVQASDAVLDRQPALRSEDPEGLRVRAPRADERGTLATASAD